MAQTESLTLQAWAMDALLQRARLHLIRIQIWIIIS